MVILACKTDPDVELQVDARQGNAIGEPYNVGLIEVTATTAAGKSKMRNGLRWLLYKLEQKMRECSELPKNICFVFHPVLVSEWSYARTRPATAIACQDAFRRHCYHRVGRLVRRTQPHVASTA